MIQIKSAREIEIMARGGEILAATVALLERSVRPGMTTMDLDKIADDFIRSHPGAIPAFKGLYNFPASICTSINQEIVHGIPSKKRLIEEGDIVSIDIGAAVQGVVEAAGFSVVRDLVGHGIGVGFHEDPQVPNYGKPKRGVRLQPGLTIAIEPMVNVGMPATRTMPDRWTVVSVDGTRSAHFEHTIAITENGPRILTALAP